MENKAVAVEDFEQTAQYLEEQIQHLIKNEPYILMVIHLVDESHNIMHCRLQVQRGDYKQ